MLIPGNRGSSLWRIQVVPDGLFEMAKKIEGTLRSPRLLELGCSVTVKNLVSERLELYPQTKLYRPRGVRLNEPRVQVPGNSTKGTPIGRIAENVIGITQVGMIKYVGEVSVELQMHSLRDHDILPDAQVHVPELLATQNSRATAVT